MKKILLGCLSFIFATTASVNAQGKKEPMELNSHSWGVTMVQGTQTIQVPDGKGTIKLVKKADKYSDVVFTDKTGKVNRLSAVNNCSNTTTKTTCEGTTDGCFATSDKKINIYFCRSAKLSGTTSRQTTITIAL